MNAELIALNLSDGSGCYGRRSEKPHIWWMRRTTTTAAPEYDQVAPGWARNQCEQALNAWPFGDVIQVVQP